MKTFIDMNYRERLDEYDRLMQHYRACQEQNLNLNMARGKPGPEQLNLSMPMLDILSAAADCRDSSGTDCRSYGELAGIKEARDLFADYMGVSTEEVIVAGSSSLSFMYDCMTRAMLKGVLGSEKPWSTYEKVKFLCPIPGYDRHFSICEFLGIEMISVPMTTAGPDMDMVETLVQKDSCIKGIWCVPKYSNPSGITYSDSTIRRLAALRPKASDFRIFYDNAYAVHDIYRKHTLLNLLEECKKSGKPDMVYIFGSTNKLTFPGAGVACFAASRANIDFTMDQLANQTISWDKLNMLRHVRFLKNMEGINKHMQKHSAILKPKFDVVLTVLSEQLLPLGIGSCTRPDGGYFVTYQAPRGCARRIVSLCKEAGLILTGAGATHPYGNDPEDSYIRIAPSFPSADELETAMQLFTVCAKLAFLETLIG